MASIAADSQGYLFVQFYFRGRLCREYVGLRDARDSRRVAGQLARTIELELKAGTFDYAARFPKSKRLQALGLLPERKFASLSEYARHWLTTLEVSKATRYDYESLLKTFLERSGLGAMRLEDLTPAHIRDVIRAATESGTRVRRATMFLQRLRSIYDSATEDGLLDKNPARRVKNPRTGKREPIEVLTHAEQAALLGTAEGTDRNLICLMLGTGARPGELLALRRKDVDLKRRKLTIAGSVGRFGEGPTKTAGSARVIDLHDGVAPVLAALRSQLDIPRLHGPLFTNSLGATLNYINWRSRNWRRLLQRAGLPYRSPYVCRHTFAVRMLEAGRDVVQVAQQMGHESTEMIHRHYARWMIRRELPESERG